MYCLVLVNWNLLGEEVGKGTSNREDQGMRLVRIVALDVSEIYQSQIRWPLEHLEIPLVFR